MTLITNEFPCIHQSLKPDRCKRCIKNIKSREEARERRISAINTNGVKWMEAMLK